MKKLLVIFITPFLIACATQQKYGLKQIYNNTYSKYQLDSIIKTDNLPPLYDWITLKVNNITEYLYIDSIKTYRVYKNYNKYSITKRINN